MTMASSKILVIRLSSLGDLILMVPMLRAIRATFREGQITLLTKERYAGLFEGSGFLDRVRALEKGDLTELLRLRAELSREKYDIIIDAHNVIRSNLLFQTLGARRKLQITKNEIKKVLLIRGKMSLYKRIITQSERYARMARSLGAETSTQEATLPIPEWARRNAESIFPDPGHDGRTLVAFAPGARWQAKVWPREYFARIMADAATRGYIPVLVGGSEDEASNADIARQAGGPIFDLTGKLSIIESAAILASCEALVTNDSAPLHLAEAVGTPVVAFFGPTVREFGYFPRLTGSAALEVKLPCRPCSRNGARECPYGTKECLTAIKPEDALAALVAVIEKKRRAS